MKKKFWLGTLALAATLCLSVGAVNVAYTANAEETATETETGTETGTETPAEETTLQLLGGYETTAYNGSSKPTTWTYNASTRSGSISHKGGDKKYWFEGVQRADKVVMADGNVEAYDAQTLRYTVTFSNQACLDSTKGNNGLGIVLVDGDIATNYWLLRNVTTPTYSKYFSQGKKGTFSGGGAWCGQNEAFKLTETSFTMTVEVTCGEALRVWYNGTEVTDSYPTYTGTTLPKVGMHTFYWSADYTVSAELVGVKSLYVEPETTYDLFGYDKAQHSVRSDGATAETNYSYDFTNKVGYIGGSASGIGVVEKERAKAYFTVATPDKVIAKDDTLIDYSAVEKMKFSITYSDIKAVDGTFDAKNNNEFIAIALCDPNASNDWAGLWVMGEQNYNHIGVLERNVKGTGLFANGDTTTTIRFGGVTSPVVDGSATLSILVTKATDDAVGSIEVLWNGVTATTFGYSGKVFPELGMYSRGVCAKVSNVSYELYGVKGVHEHTEETLAAVAATCTTDGLTEGKKCSVCDMTLVAQETIPAAHTTTKTEAVAPTCTEAGNIEYWTCSGECQSIYSDEACTTVVTDTVIPAAGHNTTKTDAQAATCTDGGWIDFWFCNVCSKIYSDESYTTEITAEEALTPATGHTEETLAAVAPTCTATGLTEGKKCTVCDETLVAQEEVAALGHTEEPLAAVAATCTATGLTEGKKCTVCDETLVAQEEVAALGHTEETLAAVAATCTATGLTEGKKCSVCDETLVAQEEVAATGHTEETLAAVAPTCTETGLTEGKKCSVCDEVLVAQEEVAATGHTESDWIVDSEAQVGVAGSKHKECPVCGETIATEEIPALEDTASDTNSDTTSDMTSNNGDNQDPVTLGCGSTVSGLSMGVVLLGMGAVALLRKKKED